MIRKIDMSQTAFIFTYKLKDLSSIVQQVRKQTEGCTVYALSGMMGAGKTTWIREFCAQQGVVDTVNSPTYALVNEYHTEKGDRIFHADLYRIQSQEELFHAGIDELLDMGGMILIEWPHLIENSLPQGSVMMNLEVVDADTRKLAVYILR